MTRLVRTPLWFKHNPEKMHQIDDSYNWIEPIDIAKAMLELIEVADYKGGDVIDVVAKGARRKVELFNDSGPFGLGKQRDTDHALEPSTAAIIKKERGE
jgi:hypothetical protein